MTRETKPGPDSFLGRWSERKAAVRRGETPLEPDPPVAAPEASRPVAPEQGQSSTPQAPPAPELPPLESLNEDSDYSVFFSEGVSEAIKRAALRKLFHTASFNVTDGLDDYDEDFRTFKSLGDVVTQEMKRRAAIDEERERAKAAARAESSDDEVAARPDEVEVAPPDEELAADAPQQPAEAASADTAEESEPDNDRRDT